MSSISLSPVSSLSYVNIPSKNLDEYLETAFQEMNFERVIQLIDQDADPSHLIILKENLLELLSENELVKLLSDCSRDTQHSYSPLCLAVILGQKELFVALLNSYQRNGIEINQVPLFAINGTDCSDDLFSLLGWSWSEVDIEDDSYAKLKALTLFCDSGEILEALLDNTNTRLYTEFIERGIICQKNECLKVFIKKSNTWHFLENGVTWPLVTAEWGNFEIFKLFLDHYRTHKISYGDGQIQDFSKISTVKDSAGQNVLHYAVKNHDGNFSSRLTFIKKVLEEFPELDINEVDFHGNTPLNLVSRYDEELIPHLLALGADPTIASFYFQTTPLHKYLISDECEHTYVQTLLDYGANPHLKNKFALSAIDIAKEKQKDNDKYDHILDLLLKSD